ncbi:hypothetical protein [Pedobacter sp. Leaf176]|uniref:hypothetical protein n=1 Tax=Pedobacter sp. Leaf176 TaxID=1736286 RepID=UPI0006F40848|nr:hypothetical protein [Pedobacter sp. Leaf176]KQR70209.1 hypothetical protein ASF92_09420 [Pedobacter sp. Leaf176]
MKKYVLFIILFSIQIFVSAQENYPKIVGYVGVVHPIATFSSAGTDFNFDGHYVVGLPVGINLWKSKRIGFSLEMVPYVRAEDGSSKTSNLLIHPGVLVSINSGFTFAGRFAFETSGRYGFTPVLSKVIVKNKMSSIFVALPVPFRFGNDKPFSTTVAFQFGLAL